ncbi:MAG: hypothetical protein ACRDD1_07020 [Planctomycetia bacterium]
MRERDDHGWPADLDWRTAVVTVGLTAVALLGVWAHNSWAAARAAKADRPAGENHPTAPINGK